MVQGKNAHTTGTEFYGNSSNFALLSQLFATARKLSGDHPDIPISTVQPPLSIVDMLYDDQSAIPDSAPPAPVTAAGRTSQLPKASDAVSIGGELPPTTRPTGTGRDSMVGLGQPGVWDCFIGSPMRLEMEYVNLFFDNIHNSLPFLQKKQFTGRCEQEIWVKSTVKQLRRDQMHFFALYNAVLAVVALTASADAFLSLRTELETSLTERSPSRHPRNAPSSVFLSKIYFRRARQLLGDSSRSAPLKVPKPFFYCLCIVNMHSSHMRAICTAAWLCEPHLLSAFLPMIDTTLINTIWPGPGHGGLFTTRTSRRPVYREDLVHWQSQVNTCHPTATYLESLLHPPQAT